MRMKFGLTVCLVATGLAAQGPEGQHWIQGKVAYVKPDSSCNCIKDDVGAGAGVGTWFTPRWGLELDALALALKSRTGAIDVHEQHLLVSGLFNLAPHAASWFPYLRAGVGGTRVPSPYSLSQETLNRVSWHGGAGVQHFFGTRGLVSLEARSVTIDTAERRVEYQGLLGLGWRWGGAAAAVAAVLPAPAPVPVPAPAPPVTPAPPPPVAPPRPPMPAPAPVPAAPPVVAAPAPPNLVIVLDDALLHFANGKALLSPQGVEAIRKVAASLKAYPGVYDVTVTGHTSSLGARAFNLGLSKRRAEAVAAILVQEGIPAARVASQGMGPDHPKADNATVEGQAHNRRVEIEVKGVNVEVRHHLTGLQH